MLNNNIIAHFTEDENFQMKMTTAEREATPTLQEVTKAGNITTVPIRAISFIKLDGLPTQHLMADGSITKRKIIQDNTVSKITSPTPFTEEILSIMTIPANYFEQNEVFEYLQNLAPDNNNAEYKTYITDDPNNLSFGEHFFYTQFNANTQKKIETKFVYRDGVFINIPNDIMVQATYEFASDIVLNANIPIYIVTTVFCNNAVGLMQSNFKMLRKIN